ncbi:MAG: hypothetical protein JW746_10355 [Candidatus Krumholzibacteriota bacterium]|nr:hypothetical protein [Candidatus Krumholzibacteriota bacterium]
MVFLRFLLIFALIYYLLKIIGRAFLSAKKRRDVGTQERNYHESPDYSDKTDQKIEDADFEDLK